MDAVKYLKEKSRMTKLCQINCEDCPLGEMHKGRDMICSELEIRYPDEAVEIVEGWAKANQQKTYLMDFLEKYPNCNKGDNGIPDSCRDNIYGTHSDCRSESCEKCWNEPMEGYNV